MKKILLGFIAMLISTISFSQKIHFNYTDSTKSSYDLEDVRKITFSDDVMNLHLLDGSEYSWNVSTIGQYEYEETALNTQEFLDKANAWDLAIFPNPTSTNLNVSFNLPQADDISITLYDLQGKVVLEKNLGTTAVGKHQQVLDISALTNGIYVCKISGGNNSVTKQIIKK
tara:strand:+ start:582 stop:1094 length:513 start_codon:yes stop_codon:yes gene_type:complete